MYRVAIIQNQSEAFELSYGNSFLSIKKHSLQYSLDLFTTEDGMKQLIETLDTYDAVIFASDALGDTLLRKFWLSPERQGVFKAFLESGKGILVLHQDKMVDEDYSFLGEVWTLKGIARTRLEHDYPTDGKLDASSKHLILDYPHQIDLAQFADRGRTSPQVVGVYWHYLEPLKSEYWVSVIRDTTYSSPRDILLASGSYTKGRIIATSLALERQGHVDLLTNVIMYIVEGAQSLAIIRRDKQISYDFRYLLSYLNVNKVAYREYQFRNISSATLASNVHSVAIIDPVWRPEDLTPEVITQIKRCLRPEGKLVYFGSSIDQEPAIVTIGGRLLFRSQYRDGIIWLKSVYDRKLGLWDGSFFSTTHVIEALAAFGENLNEYKTAMLEYIFKHDLDGSYDNVFGAACEMARLYYIFNETQRFTRTISWIRKELTDLQKPAPDIARAYMLFRFCQIPATKTEIWQVLSRDSLPNSVNDLIRYLRTAFIYDFKDHVHKFTTIIVEQQGGDGSWGIERVNRIMLTAATVTALIESRPLLATNPSLMSATENAVLKGIVYLERFDLEHTPNQQKAATVAMALLAIFRFEGDIFFPIEDFVTSQRLIQKRTENIAAFDAATNLISKLQADKVALDKEHSLLLKEHQKVQYFRSVARLLTVTFILLIVICTASAIYDILYDHNTFTDLDITFLGIFYAWLLPFWWLFVILIALWVVIGLARFGLLPKTIFRILELTASLFGITIKLGETTEKNA